MNTAFLFSKSPISQEIRRSQVPERKGIKGNAGLCSPFRTKNSTNNAEYSAERQADACPFCGQDRSYSCFFFPGFIVFHSAWERSAPQYPSPCPGGAESRPGPQGRRRHRGKAEVRDGNRGLSRGRQGAVPFFYFFPAGSGPPFCRLPRLKRARPERMTAPPIRVAESRLSPAMRKPSRLESRGVTNM